ncbi:polar amino acid transport system substrate-binding protein [Chitinivorax tropicus]|uniref:Polar amino acid transport system substrate-binding protein n=1 Tax=Chitinivorax tropicus TaxID=714531 RepID=A0A840MJS4_9PROT|nr:transporter substrate-binding domain-containing protein [Chitinivorax tropicus]MBB5016816.1 polar amino acid transport system substrate-binding protein [Chitinivorax tropicus]
MKKRYGVMLLGMLLAGAVQAGDWEKIEKKGEIVIGVRDSSPPFGFFDKGRGTVWGYDVEFGQHIAQKLGLKPVFKTVDPADRINVLKDGRVDLVLATLAKTAERMREIEFSLGYFLATQKLLVKKKVGFKDVAQLDSLSVCVPAGSSNAQYLRRLSASVKIDSSQPDTAEVFKAIGEGRCEATCGSEGSLLRNLSKLPNKADFEVPDVPLEVEVYAVGMRKGDKKLVEQVNTALLDLEKSGEAAAIYDRYFGPASPVPVARTFKITK